MNFKTAQALLGTKERKTVGRNTWLERIGPKEIGLRLHETIIVRFTPGYVELDDGGFPTPTTWARMRDFSPMAIASNGKRGMSLYVRGNWDNEYAYYPGIRVKPDGSGILKTQPNKPEVFQPTVTRSGWSGMSRGESENFRRAKFAGGYESAVAVTSVEREIYADENLSMDEKREMLLDTAAYVEAKYAEPVTRFSTLTMVNGQPTESNVRSIRQTDIQSCPFVILVPEHYREDGSCKCDDSDHRKMMIREWEYSESDFAGIPLREGRS